MDNLLQQLAIPACSNLHSTPTFRIARRVLYVVNHCFPFSSNGYAVRTHGIASGLVKAGCEVIVASRPGVPWDQPGFEHRHLTTCNHTLDGVIYVHTPEPKLQGREQKSYWTKSVEVFAEQINIFKPVAVMMASNWCNALPAAIAARESGLPFFYEVRGFWELSQAARDPGWEHSSDFCKEVAGEAAVAKAANRVFTLNIFMRDELVRRGVETDNIDLVPNGFPGWSKVDEVSVSRHNLGIQSRYVVGYIGSFNEYEGIEDLINSLALVRQRGVDAALILVGSGEPNGLETNNSSGCPKTTMYRQLAEQLGISEFLFMPGRVSPDQTAAYYALLDVVVIPRRPLAVCELVSPLKPLEAASHGGYVLMSDVAPLAELARLYPNFKYFTKGKVESLTDKLLELLDIPSKNHFRSKALATLTWVNNVAPMVAAIQACGSQNFVLKRGSASPMKTDFEATRDR